VSNVGSIPAEDITRSKTMSRTLREVKTVRKKDTEEIEEDFSEEITEISETNRLQFTLADRDVRLVQYIAESQGISYETALNIVLREAMDLYHWNIKRITK
jgi:hypothetical protein